MAGRKRKGATELEKARQQRREAIDAGFRTRHPAKALEERELRRRNRAVQRDWSHKRNGTPETHEHASRTVQGALARLHLAGDITADQLAAAAEIADVAARIAAGVTIGTMSLETRIDNGGPGDGGFFESLRQVRAEIAYTRWREALPRRDPVLAMIVRDCGISQAARRYRMRNSTAKRLLCAALDAWGDRYRDACREVDAADLLAAHAGLLG